MQQALKCKLNTRLLRLRRSDTSMTSHESHESRGENVGEFLTSVERGLAIIGSSRYLRDLIHWAERQAGPRAHNWIAHTFADSMEIFPFNLQLQVLL